MARFLFLLLSLFAFKTLKVQEPVSVQLTEKDGLPDKEFYNMLEDRKGFIWLTADKGLFRYDGRRFKNYTNSEKRGLSVFEPFEDHLGRIWCTNISGQFFYVEDDQLVTFIDLGRELNGKLAEFIVTDRNLIVFTRLKVYQIALNTKKIIKTHPAKYQMGAPFKYKERILFDTFDHLATFDTLDNRKNLIRFDLPAPNNNGKYNVDKKAIVFKVDTNLFVRKYYKNANTFYKLNLSENKYTQVLDLESLNSKKHLTFFEDEHKLWVASEKGVYIYSYNDFFSLEKHFLKDYHVTKIIKDKDNNFWFTTLSNGIFVIPNIYIEKFRLNKEHSNISTIDKVDDHTLVFGTNGGDAGIYELKTHTKNIIALPGSDRVSAILYHPTKQRTLISKDNNCFFFDHRTKKVKKMERYFTGKSFSVIDDSDVLFLDFGKVKVLDKDNFNLETKVISKDKRAYTSLYVGDTKSTFIGYVDELIRYDENWNAQKIRFYNQPIFGITLTKSANGIIWAGTFKDGIFGILNNEVVTHYTTENGLVSNRIEKIKADENKLWIATDSGIQLLDTDSGKLRTLTKRDGIISYDISGIEFFGNKVVFSSNKGLFSVDRLRAFKKRTSKNVYFDKLEINERDTILNSNYALKHNQNTLKFDFNVNGFQFNQKGKYAHRLLGLNDKWVTTSAKNNSVKYNSLAPGNYTFQVKPILIDEGAIEEISFKIKSPFWARWWFIGASTLLILGAIVLFFRKQVKKKDEERKQQIKQLSLDNELIALKLENLRSQMNPHFIFNALNSIQEYIVLNQKKLASEYLGKFADLIRTYLNHSTKGTISLQEEIDCLEMYLELEKLRFEDKLQYKIGIDDGIIPDALHIPTMLIQPYVENALKHGLLHRKKDRRLTIAFTINENAKTIKCSIVDNGVGRAKAEEHKARSHKNHQSFATKATEDRLDLLNYGKEKQVGVSITDLFENEQPTGTKVDITISYTTA